MEPDTGAKAGTHRLRSLNAPLPTELRLMGGEPKAVLHRGAWRRVLRVEEVWRVQDGWWRPPEVRRTYFRLSLEQGPVLTVYQDGEGRWWAQRY